MQTTKSTLPSLNTSFSRASSSSTVDSITHVERSPTSPVRTTYASKYLKIAFQFEQTGMADTGLQIRRRKNRSPRLRNPRDDLLRTPRRSKNGAQVRSLTFVRRWIRWRVRWRTLMFERKMLERKLERAVPIAISDSEITRRASRLHLSGRRCFSKIRRTRSCYQL